MPQRLRELQAVAGSSRTALSTDAPGSHLPEAEAKIEFKDDDLSLGI